MRSSFAVFLTAVAIGAATAISGCGSRTGLLPVDEITGEGGGATCSYSGGLEPPSCTNRGPGRTNCGDGCESCCTSLTVSGGSFFREYSNTGSGPTDEAAPATVSTLRLDKYMVTVGRFREFVRAWAAGYRPAQGSGKHAYLNGGKGLVNPSKPGPDFESGWDIAFDGKVDLTDSELSCDGPYATWTAAPDGQENLPMNCITWWEAYAFCVWDGGFMPSATEEEYARAGGSEQREYPWGSADPGSASRYAIYGNGGVNGVNECYYPTGTLEACTGASNIAPVGTATLGAGRWGQLDLSGELSSWLLDWATAEPQPCIDCAALPNSPDVNSGRIILGGSFEAFAHSLMPSVGEACPPWQRSAGGIRCGRSP
jgi:sulfatase modifying factor 1